CRWERAGHGGGGGGAGAAVQELTPAGVVAAGAGRDAIDVRNAVDYHTPGDGENSNGDVQVIGKPDEPVRLAVAVGVFEDHDGVARLEPWQGREGILHGLRYPESAAVVEIHVDRFGDVRLRRDQLDGEARRQVETFLFLQRCPCRGGRDERPKGILLARRDTAPEAGSGTNDKDGTTNRATPHELLRELARMGAEGEGPTERHIRRRPRLRRAQESFRAAQIAQIAQGRDETKRYARVGTW